MKYNPQIHHRRSIRLKGYDYSKAGAYFITICCENRESRFGKIIVGAGFTPAHNTTKSPAHNTTKSPAHNTTKSPAHTTTNSPAHTTNSPYNDDITNGQPQEIAPTMELNEYGQIAYNEWIKLSERFLNFELDVFQIMPNHMHGIIVLNDESASHDNNKIIAQSLEMESQNDQPQRIAPVNASISDVVGAYKSLVANGCLDIFKNNYVGAGLAPARMGKLWQRNYYEHIIRNRESYQSISNYIINNPTKWKGDKFFTDK